MYHLYFLTKIHHKEHALIENETILLVYGSEVKLTCNLTTPVKFFVNGAEAKGENYEIADLTMKIKNLKKADVLNSYFCNNSQGDQINFQTEITPHLYKVDFLNFFGVSGKKVYLSCYVLVGYQNNLDIEWMWKNPKGEILNLTHRFEITSKNESSTLTIHDSMIEDSGIYECIAVNTYGSHSRTLKLVVKSNLTPLWPFLGTIGQFVVLAFILLYYEFGAKREVKFFKNKKTTPLVERNTI
ncbi:hypothetical protein BpHYR1_012191 [Brachionus plicatilis]|uniref:Ig-like domain-containing protein n=1 Tax=Brachionus plicatilis TaxID=10195 RepID=A0A3M7Q5W6_BRAPC|nr:hypothetical protein BpHYR1_012191 [Brachionus plicatilis]